MATILRFLFTRLVALPRTVPLTIVAVALAYGALWQARRTWHDYVTGLDNAGYVRAQREAGATIDAYATHVLALQSQLASARGRTDTLRLAVTRRADAATTAIAAVPVDMREAAPPPVVAALDACDALVIDVARLTEAQLTERTAARAVITADSAMIGAQALALVHARATEVRLLGERDRKPGWRTVAKASVVALAGGVAVGRWVVPR